MDTVAVVEFLIGGPHHDWPVSFDPAAAQITLSDKQGTLARLDDATSAVREFVEAPAVGVLRLPTISDPNASWTITRFANSEEWLLHNTFGEPCGALTRAWSSANLLRDALA